MSLSEIRGLSHAVALCLLICPVCLFTWQTSLSSVLHKIPQSSHIKRQLRYGNEWSSWTTWSPCSRSCGGGASVRTRMCLTRNAQEGPCPGEPRQYKICNVQVCPAGSIGFRDLQCAAYNDKSIMGSKKFQWTTFIGGSDPCDLSCLALGQNFYYNFGHVLDGTPCPTETDGVCIKGQCLRPGCDLILGSEKRADACMVCGGHNSSCLRHRSVYQDQNKAAGRYGYDEVTMIPAGATHIHVIDNSGNFLALQNGNSQFVINGNWEIDLPGEYNVAGTKLVYKRSTDNGESFEVQGPTQEDLHIMVLLIERNSAIEYEYWLPLDIYVLYHEEKSQLRQSQQSATSSPEQQPLSSTITPPTSTARIKKPSTVTGIHLWESANHRQNFQPQARLERDENQKNLFSQHGNSCGKCKKIRGKENRAREYCQKDFVFRGKILEKTYRGQETRYDVQVMYTYRNRFPLIQREFIWVPNLCNCPQLEKGLEYLIMARRHVNYEQTLNRILLETNSYVKSFHPREDQLLRHLDTECVKQKYSNTPSL
ncbi:ADAMTS-like protein 5 isoform X1 [Erpetoichthys calabaricus]|uniref:ADAMTS-like protein 5 isoform X1 n=1 Tax=Erpetoichthys calabaricus TaxID=27687 RepID=UPI00223461A4|nr:ADAMTS-like protein 5 isoform X1 [Erpetoichthys calabaricus]